ncbi:hypothetical protein [Pseudomonas syringae group genomosp. 3]|uniref:hypothetical protein n=1 Tax=Pseudomonas syringae group genomosp. 3 TaxID=251701 RepID=UPI0006E5C701|nr:hypothetical protein [Pseudomonas syringae group genomosp. 3]KPX25637.1 hypothetical protein ALO72_200152 [Pseudomonas syringae pv. delphinii]
MLPRYKADADTGGIAVVNTGPGSVTVAPAVTAAAVSSLLNPLLLKIVEGHTPYGGMSEIEIEYPEVDEKLEYNNVSIFSEDIIENAGYMELIESLISAIDDEEPGAQRSFLFAINQKYKVAKKELFLSLPEKPANSEQKLQAIRMGSDQIILAVSDLIVDVKAGFQDFPVELVEWARQLIVCYGFINCKILEPPKK